MTEAMGGPQPVDNSGEEEREGAGEDVDMMDASPSHKSVAELLAQFEEARCCHHHVYGC